MKKTSVLFAIVIALVLFTIHKFTMASGGYSKNINPEVWAQFGSFIAPVLLVTTLAFQFISFKRQQIENKFFEMVKYYRENVSEIAFDDPFSKSSEKSKVQGRQSFVKMFHQFLLAKNIISSISKAEEWKTENLLISEENKENEEKLIAEVAFQFVYWGVSKSNSADCKSNLKKYIIPEKINQIFNHLKLFPVNYSALYQRPIVSEIFKIFNDSELDPTETQSHLYNFKNEINIFNQTHTGYIKFFGGHQYHLGHYFRHLYQTVRFIDQQPCYLISKKEKYEYIKTLRAQMSNYEQAIFFLNSLTPMGVKWHIKKQGSLISKYNLIKNIPQNFIPGLNPKQIYPDVNFEYEI